MGVETKLHGKTWLVFCTSMILIILQDGKFKVAAVVRRRLLAERVRGMGDNVLAGHSPIGNLYAAGRRGAAEHKKFGTLVSEHLNESLFRAGGLDGPMP